MNLEIALNKKIAIIILIICFVFSLYACDDNSNTPPPEEEKPKPVEIEDYQLIGCTITLVDGLPQNEVEIIENFEQLDQFLYDDLRADLNEGSDTEYAQSKIATRENEAEPLYINLPDDFFDVNVLLFSYMRYYLYEKDISFNRLQKSENGSSLYVVYNIDSSGGAEVDYTFGYIVLAVNREFLLEIEEYDIRIFNINPNYQGRDSIFYMHI